MFFVVKLYIFR